MPTSIDAGTLPGTTAIAPPGAGAGAAAAANQRKLPQVFYGDDYEDEGGASIESKASERAKKWMGVDDFSSINSSRNAQLQANRAWNNLSKHHSFTGNPADRTGGAFGADGGLNANPMMQQGGHVIANPMVQNPQIPTNQAAPPSVSAMQLAQQQAALAEAPYGEDPRGMVENAGDNFKRNMEGMQRATTELERRKAAAAAANVGSQGDGIPAQMPSAPAAIQDIPAQAPPGSADANFKRNMEGLQNATAQQVADAASDNDAGFFSKMWDNITEGIEKDPTKALAMGNAWLQTLMNPDSPSKKAAAQYASEQAAIAKQFDPNSDWASNWKQNYKDTRIATIKQSTAKAIADFQTNLQARGHQNSSLLAPGIASMKKAQDEAIRSLDMDAQTAFNQMTAQMLSNRLGATKIAATNYNINAKGADPAKSATSGLVNLIGSEPNPRTPGFNNAANPALNANFASRLARMGLATKAAQTPKPAGWELMTNDERTQFLISQGLR